ncbi:hypothetical protein I4U23_006778 [Adineta vaga]|nr:hypothetical protein I4U23_006778 [Adineta vaga]
MIETSRIYLTSGLVLLILTLIFHFVAMGYPRWKTYDHREKNEKTITVGIFHRCENLLVYIAPTMNKTYSICDYNKYIFPDNKDCSDLQNPLSYEAKHRVCHPIDNPCHCDYSSITKGLMACTIIAACTLSLAFLLMFSHLLINSFKYQIHFYLTAITIVLLLLGLIFILITLILFGSSLLYDLYQYHFDLNNRLAAYSKQEDKNNLRFNVTQQAKNDYHTRLDWAAGLEIIALFLTSFTLITQILYLISIYRNRNG